MSSRILVAAAITAVSSHASLAQAVKAPTDTTPRFTIGSTHVIAGMARFQFADLDTRVAAAGLPAVARSAATIGLGADIRVRRLMFGAGFQSLLTRDHRNDAYRTRFSGSYTLLDVGAAVLNRGGWLAYPIAGLGLTQLSVNVRETGEFTFDEGLSHPARELGMSGLGTVSHLGFLLERHFHRGTSEYALSVRAGVMRGFGSQSWQSDAKSVDDGPTGVRGSYMRLTFSRPVRARRDALLPAAGAVAQAVLR